MPSVRQSMGLSHYDRPIPKAHIMTKNLVYIGILAVLAACSGERPAPADAGPEPGVAAAITTASGPGEQKCVDAYSPLPKAVVLTPYHVRSDRIYTTKTGAERRRATLELLE